MQHSLVLNWPANYFGIVVALIGLVVIAAGSIISDDLGFLFWLTGAAAILAGLVGQALRRLFTS